MNTFYVCLWAVLCSLGLADAQDTSTTLVRHNLDRFDLATCSDGSRAAYYAEEARIDDDSRVMLYLPNDPTASCVDAASCQRKCDRFPDKCSAPIESSLVMSEGIWSQDRRNNPFADYVKVYLPSCSNDEFSGSRGASAATGGIVFHGRHIFSSMLRDLTAKYGLDRAKSVVLVGTGSGARGAARNCDFLAEAIATVNPSAEVRCVLDGIDLVPFWVHETDCNELENRLEDQKFLWGRQDDESCVSSNSEQLNSTQLALNCGVFSSYWRYLETPFFVTANQLDQKAFSETTCGITSDSEAFTEHTVAWRQGVLTLAETISVDKPENGWFIPNCDAMPGFLDAEHAELRRSVGVARLEDDSENPSKQNVLQTLHSWITTGENHQAIDAFGVPNDACSEQRSLPLDLRPDTFIPELDERSDDLRRAPIVGTFAEGEALPARSTFPEDDAFLLRAPSRFAPPRDLLRDSSVVANAAPDGHIPIDDFLDYDGFSLGSDFDYGIETGVAPGVASAIGGVPRVAAADPGVAAAVVPAVAARPALIPGRRPAVVHSQARRRSLWRRLHYLEYLRNLYARHYRAYHHEYYGTGIPVAAAVPAAVRPAVVRRFRGGGFRRVIGAGPVFARIQERPDVEPVTTEKEAKQASDL